MDEISAMRHEAATAQPERSKLTDWRGAISQAGAVEFDKLARLIKQAAAAALTS